MTKPAIVRSIEALNKIRDSVEIAFVDTVGGFIPWLAPVIPAYVAYQHIYTVLEFPSWVALFTAVVVEGLGFTTVSTAVEFHRWNLTRVNTSADPRKRKYQSAPLVGAVTTILFYLFIVLTVNVVLDVVTIENIETYANGDRLQLIPALARSFAIFLLSLMTLVGAYSIAIRTEHRQHKLDVENGVTSPRPAAATRQRPKFGSQHKQAVYDYIMTNPEWAQNKSATAEAIGVSRPTLDKYLGELESEGYVK